MSDNGGGPTVAITGASGLVGTDLALALLGAGRQVKRLVRRPVEDRPEAIFWDPAAGKIDAGGLAGVDEVVHLAGENIATGRWNAAKKARIRDSRVKGTALLCETLASLDQRPRVLVSASAIGYYGHRGEVALDEQSTSGSGFLPEVCRAWEEATGPAREAGIRVVNLRIGVVLDKRGGALAKMLTPFTLGLGGVVGSGAQYISWITLADLVGAIAHALAHDELAGPVNGVAPEAATNRHFTKTLGKVLGRPTIFPMPTFAARLAFGEMGDELLLASTRVVPRQLEESGYQFQYPNLEAALRHILGK